jgi:hypothetical protein
VSAAYGRTKSGTVVHLLDDPRGFGAYRARCGVHLDALIVTPLAEAQLVNPFEDSACANCAAVLPLGRPRRRP